MKALLLAAGYGTRLKPLTDSIPKPLTLFMGRPILDIVYDQVRAEGIEQVAVNTHHLAMTMQMHIQNLAANRQPIHISYEPEILGTGGCINPLRDWLEDEDLLIFNGDIVSSIDLSAFIRTYKASKAKAAMVLIPHRQGTTPLTVESKQVIGIGTHAPDSASKTFAGIHIVSRAFIEQMPLQGFFSVIDTYQNLLTQGELILAFEHSGFWADLGIPSDYLEAHREFWSGSNTIELAKALQLSTQSWDYDVSQQSLFVDTPRIQGVRNSFLFGPLRTDGVVELERCIVYPGVDLAEHRHKRGMIISPKACLSIL